MKIIFVRHAAAIDRCADIIEERRYLTPEGRDFCRKTARTILKKGVKPDLILTSPLLRAVQTADILAENLAYRGPLMAVDELEPGFALHGLRQLLNRFQPVNELIVVGHEPDLSTVVAELLCLDKGFKFKKGGALKLVIKSAALPGDALFKWFAIGNTLIVSRNGIFDCA